MDKEKTGELIKNARLQKGYTQKELGDLIGVTNKAVSRWENGESFPDIAILERLSVTLNLSIEDMVLGVNRSGNEQKAIHEIINLAKKQEKQIRNKYMTIIVIGMIVIGFIYISNKYFHGVSEDFFNIDSLFSLIVILTVMISIILQKFKNSLKTKSKFCRLLSIVSIISGVYVSFLAPTILTMVNNNLTPFGIEESKLGPFVMMQYIIIYLINLVILGILILQAVQKENVSIIGLFNSVTVLHLVLSFSNLLHHYAVDLKSALFWFIINTLENFIVMFIMIAIMYTSKKYICKKNE